MIIDKLSAAGDQGTRGSRRSKTADAIPNREQASSGDFLYQSESAEPTTVIDAEAIPLPSETTAPNLPVAR